MSDDRLITVGKMLAALPRPMSPVEVRRFAEELVNHAIDQSPLSITSLAWFELEPRGGTFEQCDDVSAAVLDVVSRLSLTEARSIIGSVWVGAIYMKE